VAKEFKRKKDGSVTVFARDADGRRKIFGNLGAGRSALPTAQTQKPQPANHHHGKPTGSLASRIDDLYHRYWNDKRAKVNLCPDFGKLGHDVDTCAVCAFSDVMTGLNEETVAATRAAWEKSPFKWMLNLGPKVKGALGEKAVERWLTKYGFDVQKPESMEHDRIVNGRKVEVKMSMMWEDGRLNFAQIRDQDYEVIVLVGYEPQKASMWVLPKSVAIELSDPQHGGSDASGETRWFGFQPSDIPEIMKQYGGTPERALASARKLLRK
jgi:hypothetical protein